MQQRRRALRALGSARGDRASALNPLRTGPCAAAGALAACLCLTRGAAAAEPIVQLAGYAGYAFGGSADARYQSLSRSASIEDAPSYGGTLSFNVGRGAYAELAYSRQDTDVLIRAPEGTLGRYDLSVQYFTVGGVQQFRLPGTDIVRPVFAGSIGAVRFGASTESQSVDDWHLSLILEGGLVLQLIENFGLRFRARLLTTFLASQSTLFCGTQGGCAYSFTGTALFQGDMSAGAFVAF
jgi:hypothetical protein